MPFHKTSLGLLGERLPCDLHGYVPQDGDSWEEFTWEPRTEWTPASWSLFVEQAVQATQQAEEATLRTQGDPGRALVAEAAAIAERAWEDSCQDDRELLSAVCALHRHAERVAFLLSPPSAGGRLSARAGLAPLAHPHPPHHPRAHNSGTPYELGSSLPGNSYGVPEFPISPRSPWRPGASRGRGRSRR